MSYEQQNFTDGQVLSAAHLNHMEEGIAKNRTDTETLQEKTQDLETGTAGLNSRVRALEFSPAVAIAEQAEGTQIQLQDSANMPLQAMTVYGRSTQDGTPAPDVPQEIQSVGDGGSITISTAGKNLLAYPYVMSQSAASGITWTVNADGSVTATGTATAESSITLRKDDLTQWLMAETPYQCVKNISGVNFQIYYFEGNVLKTIGAVNGSNTVGVEFSIPSDVYNNGKTKFVRLWCAAGAVLDHVVIYPMVVKAAAREKTWEPYRAGTATLTTGLPLYGIPVESGGNVTVDGQGYIADTLEIFADGSSVISPLCKVITVDGSKNPVLSSVNETTVVLQFGIDEIPNVSIKYHALMCDHGTATTDDSVRDVAISNGNIAVMSMTNPGWNGSQNYRLLLYFPLSIASTLAEAMAWLSVNPVTTLVQTVTNSETIPLTAQEVQEFLELRTYKPVTNISNDAGAYMAVSYVADTKTYIDNRIAAFQGAVS